MSPAQPFTYDFARTTVVLQKGLIVSMELIHQYFGLDQVLQCLQLLAQVVPMLDSSVVVKAILLPMAVQFA